MVPRLENRAARRLFLHLHGLGKPTAKSAKGPDLCVLIERLGFVQVDSINTVERAHHMILHARCHSYRPENLAPLLEQDRTLFEHWTHDAAIIPTSFYPHWHLRFERDAKKLRKRWKEGRRGGFNKAAVWLSLPDRSIRAESQAKIRLLCLSGTGRDPPDRAHRHEVRSLKRDAKCHRILARTRFFHG